MSLLAGESVQIQSPRQDSSAPKRRRISLEEVEHELRLIGLCQPALSFSHAPPERACDELLILKRGCETQSQTDMSKRRRFCSQYEPVQTVVETPAIGELQTRLRNVMSHASADGRLKRMLTSLVGIDSIVPVCGESSQRGHILYDQLSIPKALLEPRRKRDGPFGLTFASGDGILVADFPREWRPTLLAASGSPAAKIAIDVKGTAYFLSEDGELLVAIPAIRYLEDVMCNQGHEVKVQLLSVEDKTGDTKKGSNSDHASQHSTDVLSPSFDVQVEIDDLDANMDTT